ncbi:helix-turn-helix domain-containing protein [Streptomyces sp. bgisy100]|uniref:helix-turn-helix domain-containing protein n=1 Tax=Streptomyces sp. bgisy100 TaxID=3413783 RepID=UPI003D703CD8
MDTGSEPSAPADRASSLDVLTVPEVMKRLRMSRPKVYDLLRTGKLQSFTEGRARRIPVVSLAAYIQHKIEEAA